MLFYCTCCMILKPDWQSGVAFLFSSRFIPQLLLDTRHCLRAVIDSNYDIYEHKRSTRRSSKIDILKPCWEAISSHFVIYVWSSCDLFVSKCNVLIWLLCCHFYDCLQLFALSRSTFNGIAGSILLLVYKKAYFQRKVTDIPTRTVTLKHFAWKHFHILQHLRRICEFYLI